MKNMKKSRFNNLIRRKTNEDELGYNLEDNDNENEKTDESRKAVVNKVKKPEVKNLRQIGYGAAGLTIGVIAYLLLSASAPTVNQVRSTLPEFASAGQSSGYEDEFGYEDELGYEDEFWNDEGFDEDVVVNEEYTGDVVPLHPFGSYRVTRTEFDEYERNETVRYGKVNPTFFFNKSSVSQEETEKEEELMQQAPLVENNNASEDNTDDNADNAPISLDIGGRGENVITGFNIHTTKTEEYNVANIREQFAKHAVLPVDAEYFNISSTYGIRVDPFTKGRAFHAGVDFSKTGISGSNIYAVMGGKITEAVASTSKEGLGNYVVIDHGEFHTVYAHMTDGPTLEVDDVVQAGDIVGTVGSTGRSTGPHLHFEVGVGGVKFDGLEFLIHIVDKDNNGYVTVEEAKQAGFTGDIDSEHWLYSYMTKGE